MKVITFYLTVCKMLENFAVYQSYDEITSFVIISGVETVVGQMKLGI